MGSGSGRSLAPLLARFARRFEGSLWGVDCAPAVAFVESSGSSPPPPPRGTDGNDRAAPSLALADGAPPPPLPPPSPPRPWGAAGRRPSPRGPRARPRLLPELARHAHFSAATAAGRPSSAPKASARKAAGQAPPRPPPPSPPEQEQQRQQHQPILLRRLLPPPLIPYAELMRLDKPVGSWLLAWPGLWSIALASSPSSFPETALLSLLFAAGSVLLRGAGCTVNDLLDRDIDARVERTRSRPLASGAVTPLSATIFLGGQLSLGLVILSQLNGAAQALGALSLGLVATYPLMKRVTWWPQAFLGLTINWGALMGFAAASPAAGGPGPVRLTAEAAAAAAADPAGAAAAAAADAAASLAAVGPLEAWLPALALYGSGVAWTLVYDTIYAHQDIRDDVKAGVRSTARLFADRGVSRPALAFFAAAQASALVAAGALAGLGPAYYLGAAAAGAHVARQVATVDLNDGPDCAAKFASNKWAGGMVWAGIVADRLLAPTLF